MSAMPEVTLPTSNLPTLTSLESRALELLGDGHPQEVVASTLGVTPARITQLMSLEWFSNEVSKLRFTRLQTQTIRDKSIDRIEDKILVKLEKSLPLITRTGDLVKAFQVLNSAKRRGSPVDTAAQLINQTVINLTLPAAIVNKYKSNEQAQVVEVNGKSFLTAPSNLLPELAKSVEVKDEVHDAAKAIRAGIEAAETATKQISRAPISNGSEISADDL